MCVPLALIHLIILVTAIAVVEYKSHSLLSFLQPAVISSLLSPNTSVFRTQKLPEPIMIHTKTILAQTKFTTDFFSY
jgi:hypothetical protein